MHGSTSSPSLGHVKVLSRNGLYLETTERWPTGEVVSLTLQKEDTAAGKSELLVDLQARVASLGEDGIGLGFILPEELNADLWEHFVETADTPKESEDAQLVFRMVRTILFLCRLCPSRATEPVGVVVGELDELRTRNMLTIALAAEKILSAEPDAEDMRADPHVVASILNDGSWAQDPLAIQLWAGLLASSASFEGSNQAIQDSVELIVNLTASQLHIVVEGCKRAYERSAKPDSEPIPPVVITAKEMVQVSGISDLNRCAADVANLHHHGLVERICEFTTYQAKTSFDITPTHLGLQMFKLCKGHIPAHVVVPS
jgi:hypothetical protein